MGSVPAVNAATVDFITACFASSLAPLTIGIRRGAKPAPALARISAFMMPELTTPPVTLAKLLAGTVRTRAPTVRTISPVRT